MEHKKQKLNKENDSFFFFINGSLSDWIKKLFYTVK